ncbi:neprilysin-1-like [Haemaphysalis longicornis]
MGYCEGYDEDFWTVTRVSADFVMIVERLNLRTPLQLQVLLFPGATLPTEFTPNEEAATTQPCHEDLKLFMGTFNQSVDACEDFHAHVCGGGEGRSDMWQDTPHVLQENWYHQAIRFLEEQKAPAGALAIYNACLAQWSRDVGDLARVIQFLRERGMPWPAPTGGRYHALDVILDMVINWAFHFFFELTLSRRPGNKRYSLLVNYVDTVRAWELWVNVTRKPCAHVGYAGDLYRIYGAWTRTTSQLEQVLRNERSIMQIISHSARQSSNRGPLTLRMADIGNMTPSLSASLWLTSLNKHLRPYVLHPDDELLVVGDAVGTALDRIFSRYTNDQILEFVAWWFVQMYSSSLSHSAAVATSASWLDENARLQAAAILNRTQLEPEIWRQCGNETWSISPPLRAYIGAIPRTFGTAFEGWIEAAKIHRDHFPGWPINGSILHHNNNFYQLVNYDYWRNSIYAHPAVLSQPVYYADGPDAIMYGGLGVMLARKLVKAIDVKGVFLDADRRPHNWLSKKSWEVLMKKVICAGNSVTLSEIAAIEVAVEAYEATVRSYDSNKAEIEERSLIYWANSSERQGAGPGSINEKRLFFMAAARSVCGLEEPSSWPGRHVSDFGLAFSCPTGKPMNPVAKCSFFGG